MVPYINNTTPRQPLSLAFSEMAAAAGAQLSEYYAHQEHPPRKPRPHEWQWTYPVRGRKPDSLGSSSSTASSSTSKTTTPPGQSTSFDPSERHPLSYIRPSNWKGPEHGAALLAVWATLNTAEKSRASAGEDVWDLQEKLAVANDLMRGAFPALGQGEVRLKGEWLEWVLGRQGVKPFSDKAWREKLVQ